MKSFRILYLVATLFCASIVSFTFSGCGSTPEATATHLAGTTVATVDSAMQAWGDWVRAGNATQAQMDAVKAAYAKYYAAATASDKALEAYVAAKASNPNADRSTYTAAIAAAQSAQSELLNLITVFKGK